MTKQFKDLTRYLIDNKFKRHLRAYRTSIRMSVGEILIVLHPRIETKVPSAIVIDST